MENRRNPRSCSNIPNWKLRLRENCYKRVREDRNRLLWKIRSPSSNSNHIDSKDVLKIAMRDILSDELNKISDFPSDDNIQIPSSTAQDDFLWEYDASYNASQGDCEDILLEMQNIFYQQHPTGRELENYIMGWEEEEDEYLARAVFEHMQLNDKQVHKEEIWCPICKKGELLEDHHLIFCSVCEFKLKSDIEVNIELLKTRLAEVHAAHLDRGCRLKPEFCIESRAHQCTGHGLFQSA